MDSDQGKLFIGGISWETSEEKLNEHFGQYGQVLQSVIMRDKLTARPRGFGFVVFADPSVLDIVLQDKHSIDGRTVEAKRALSREEQHTSARPGNPSAGRNFEGGDNMRTKKIFVGGLPPSLKEEEFRQYFETYGHVIDVVVMYDQSTQRPRGFGFISFDSEEAVDRVLHKTFHDLGGKMVEVKRALPKDANPNSGGRSMGGGGYHGYGASGSYDGRAESNRYMQPQAAGGNFPPYGASGYGAPGYGYGAASNGVGYGGYGVGGYGNASGGYGGPAGGAYGNPSANAGYGGGSAGAPRSSWGAQAAGYGSAPYNANSGYGAQAPWGAAGSGGTAAGSGTQSAPTGQSPTGTAGYGNQGYGGYGGYGGSDGSYANPSSYGAVGGRTGSTPNSTTAGVGGDQQGSGTGYGGGSYNDASSGYQATGWRSDPSQGGNYGAGQTNGVSGSQVGYGGYGRQTQQQ